TRDQAREALLSGDTPEEIAQRIGCSSRTVRGWAKAGGWYRMLVERRNSLAQLDSEISRLTGQRSTNASADRLAKLTKARDRLARQQPKPKPRPTVRQAVSAELMDFVLSEAYGLYSYQREVVESEDRFRHIRKSRQIGFSYLLGLLVVLGATAGRNQLVVSASENQAHIVLAYARQHMARLGIVPTDDTANCITINGVDIRVLSTNWRTAQGFHGDVWFDEFAWLRPKHQKMIWGALVPSITAVGGRVTISTTPFLPATLDWEIAENHKGRWGQFARWKITIHDAIAQGMPLPGGIDELRGLFDADTWAMFYLCEYAEGGDSLLSWQALHDLTVPDVSALRVGRLRAGMDIGRTGHRTAIALLGQERDRVTDGFTDRFVLSQHWLEKNMPFAAQRALALDIDQRHEIREWRIDRTGLGMQLAEELSVDMSPRAIGVHFDAAKKQRMALGLLKLVEDKRLVLPNDPDVLASLHSVQKIVSGNSLRYDAPSDETGHGDLFWALGMLATGARRGGSMGNEVKVEVWN
ncbi:MAG: terminase family protein, partial [Burkholderiaceae bacterium]|nr:terminase family protein [Burkholderiaceae bacterium]